MLVTVSKQGKNKVAAIFMSEPQGSLHQNGMVVTSNQNWRAWAGESSQFTQPIVQVHTLPTYCTMITTQFSTIIPWIRVNPIVTVSKQGKNKVAIKTSVISLHNQS